MLSCFWVGLWCRNWDAFSLGKKSCGAGFIVGYLLGSGCAPSLLHLERYCDDLGANPLFFELCVLCRGDLSSARKANSGERLFAFVWCGFVLGHLFAVLTLGVPYFFAFFHFFPNCFSNFLLFLW